MKWVSKFFRTQDRENETNHKKSNTIMENGSPHNDSVRQMQRATKYMKWVKNTNNC
jgi:hypothetical protein